MLNTADIARAEGMLRLAARAAALAADALRDANPGLANRLDQTHCDLLDARTKCDSLLSLPDLAAAALGLEASVAC